MVLDLAQHLRVTLLSFPVISPASSLLEARAVAAGMGMAAGSGLALPAGGFGVWASPLPAPGMGNSSLPSPGTRGEEAPSPAPSLAAGPPSRTAERF